MNVTHPPIYMIHSFIRPCLINDKKYKVQSVSKLIATEFLPIDRFKHTVKFEKMMDCKVTLLH